MAFFSPSKPLALDRKQQKPLKPKKSKNTALFWALFLAASLAVGIFVAINQKWGIEEKRAEKLEKLLKNAEEGAEQYALRAMYDGLYPCYSCAGQDSIFLFAHEIWKYGIALNGEKGRYSSTYLLSLKVSYHLEYQGDLTECYRQEKIKIFTYPNLPENLKRGATKLFRPPGNIYD